MALKKGFLYGLVIIFHAPVQPLFALTPYFFLAFSLVLASPMKDNLTVASVVRHQNRDIQQERACDTKNQQSALIRFPLLSFALFVSVLERVSWFLAQPHSCTEYPSIIDRLEVKAHLSSLLPYHFSPGHSLPFPS